MEEPREQALVRSRAFCVWPEPILFVTYEHQQKILFSLLHNLKTIYDYKYIENADLGKHCLLLNKLGFPRWRHKYSRELCAQHNLWVAQTRGGVCQTSSSYASELIPFHLLLNTIKTEIKWIFLSLSCSNLISDSCLIKDEFAYVSKS